EQLGVAVPDDVRPLLRHPAISVRVQALQVGDRWLAADEGRALLDDVLAASAEEVTSRGRIQFVLSLGETRDDRAFKELARYARDFTAIRWLNTAILSSVGGRAPELLGELLNERADPAT